MQAWRGFPCSQTASFYTTTIFPFFIPSYTPCPGNSLIAHRPFSSGRFSMQRYSVCPVVKHRFANGSRILRQPSANRRWASSPASLQGIAGRAWLCSYIRRLGIPSYPVHCLLALSVLFPLSVLHKNHTPTRSRKSFKKREKQENLN